jgi:hypothetical protein
MGREQEEGSSSRRIGHEQERPTVHGSDAERGTHPVPAKSAASLGNCVFTRRMVERVKGVEPIVSPRTQVVDGACILLNRSRAREGFLYYPFVAAMRSIRCLCAASWIVLNSSEQRQHLPSRGSESSSRS